MPPKRKQASTSTTEPSPKKAKPSSPKESKSAPSKTKKEVAKKPPKTTQTHIKSENGVNGTTTLEKPIVINRAPVLELWSACVASTIHPDLEWSTCLSIGSSISSITAISKGRSIGVIDDKKKDGKKATKNDAEDIEQVEVMGFKLDVKDGVVFVKGKPKTTKEVSLQRKYGPDGYEKVKEVMIEVLESWKGNEAELDGKAFHMYEQFRPSVPKGQQGWGRKGELNLEKLREVVRK